VGPSPTGTVTLSQISETGLSDETKTSIDRPQTNEAERGNGDESGNATTIRDRARTKPTMRASWMLHSISSSSRVFPSVRWKRETLVEDYNTGTRNSFFDRIPIQIQGLRRRLTSQMGRTRHTRLAIDESSMKGLELYLDVTADRKEYVVQRRWPPVVFLPESNILVVWQSIIALSVLVTAVTTPLDTVFYNEGSLLGGAEHAFLAIFVLDILVNFSTGVRDIRGYTKLDGALIAWRYIRSPWFFLDIVSIIPFEAVFGSGGGAQTAKSLKLLRLARLNKLVRRVDEVFEMGALQIVVLIGAVALFVHWMSCGWRAVGCSWMRGYTSEVGASSTDGDLGSESDDGPPTLDLVHACESYTNIYEVYAVCLSQACSSMLGGGSTSTFYERTYFACVVVAGAIMQASVFGSIAKSMAQMDEERHTFDKKLSKITHRMRYLQVPRAVQEKVVKFYENMWNFTKTDNPNPYEFIDHLSPPLRGEMQLALYRNMLMKMPYLKKMDIIMAERFVQQLRGQSYMKGDFIIRAGEPGDWLAFMEQGTAAILDPSSVGVPLPQRKIIRVLEVGDYFGEVSLFFGTRRTADIVAMTWVNLEILDRSSWDSMKVNFRREMTELEDAIKADTGSWMRAAARKKA